MSAQTPPHMARLLLVYYGADISIGLLIYKHTLIENTVQKNTQTPLG